MKPKSPQAVFFMTESAGHYCISTSLALYKRVLHNKTLNFQGIEDISQQFCARCPYPREEWSKGLVHDPDRYEPREPHLIIMNHLCSYSRQTSTTSYQEAAVTAGLSPVMPWAATGRQPSNMTSLCPVPSGEERSENSRNVAVSPYLWSVQQNWTLIKKKIGDYWKQTTWLNQNKSAAA